MYRKILLFFVLSLFLAGCAQESEETEDRASLSDGVIDEIREPSDGEYAFLDIEQLTGERYYYYLVVEDFLCCATDSKDTSDEVINEYMTSNSAEICDYIDEIKMADAYYFIEAESPDEGMYVSGDELTIPVLLYFGGTQSDQARASKIFWFTVQKVTEPDNIQWKIITVFTRLIT
ncbi:MAG: hypothetical protein NC432_13030 [Roseburia sp.]|nr:hypothetical protein [Roseburia sp.]MCM1098602.1 hypothetical protein [Ruminococcus flavefaciens]MCM1233638.1 hypothetical protein [Ruminococcus flavefaciens]